MRLQRLGKNGRWKLMNSKKLNQIKTYTPYDVGYFNTTDGQEIYFEQSGHPMGVPVLYLHGGPGAGLGNDYRELFSSFSNIRLIGIDQRGAGKSKPLGTLKNNTIHHLIADIEYLREYLHVSSWYIFGGSWGSTLALAYSVQFPQHIRGLNLWGIFYCQKKEIEWLFHTTAPLMYPDIFSDLNHGINHSSLKELLEIYYIYLHQENTEREFATRWLLWEAFTAEHPHPIYDEFDDWNATNEAIACAKIEHHYFSNTPLRINQEDDLESAVKKANFQFPIYITHGRNDLVTPAASAISLKNNTLNSKMNILDNCGHSLIHVGMRNSIHHFAKELLEKYN
ncbi:alpha/beta fold hydrolase [Flammeovirga kamogawensis]|nr:alpha/beta fold hydrolase [Flammeovirga kamogawensis]MBB6460906.1 proline iminopeptidase [Flammeovirga kamogawensis]